MSEQPLPSVETAYRSLIENGDMFASSPRRPKPLGVTYLHPSGNLELAVDTQVLGVTDRLLLGDAATTEALRLTGARIGSLELAFSLIKGHLSGEPLVWGISGFASPGTPYSIEAKVMEALFEFLNAKAAAWPSLITDGGGGMGVPGLSSLLALRFDFCTLGFTAYEGLSLLAPRRLTVVHGRSFKDRLKLVGITPDVLLCFGGGNGAKAECIAAIEHGGIVVLFDLKDAGPESLCATWHQEPALVSAAASGQLLVCDRSYDVYAAIRWCLDQAAQAIAARPQRLAAVAAEFGISVPQDN